MQYLHRWRPSASRARTEGAADDLRGAGGTAGRYGRHRDRVGNVDVQEWGAAIRALHIADVEVDPETGKVTLLRYTVVQDVGQAIQPGPGGGPDAGRRHAGHRLGALRGL